MERNDSVQEAFLRGINNSALDHCDCGGGGGGMGDEDSGKSESFLL